MTQTVISRGNSWLRPYNLDGGKVDTIIFYNETGILLTSRSGWLENAITDNSLRDIQEITLDHAPKQRNKENFTRKEHFYIKHSKKSNYDDPTRTLYIYVDNKNVCLEKEKDLVEKSEGYNGQDLFMHYEFYKLSGLIVEREVTTPIATNKLNSVRLKAFIKSEYKDNVLSQQVRELHEICKGLYINVSEYDLTKLLKVVEVTKREKPLEV